MVSFKGTKSEKRNYYYYGRSNVKVHCDVKEDKLLPNEEKGKKILKWTRIVIIETIIFYIC